MGKLPFYKNLGEKSAYFFYESSRIDTKKRFDHLWDRLHDLAGKGIYRFRGCNEAKYKLYTSAQRYWNEREIKKQRISYHNFIQRLINHSMHWNNGTIRRFFTQNNINLNNALAYLSYMQHYGMPTPLLDFTANPFSGLYFAVENSTFLPSERHLLSHSILFVSTNNSAYKILNNLNILNQEGVFFFNSNAIMPIEEAYKKVMADFLNNLGADLFAQYGYQEHFAECVNIHKSLRPYVLAKLKTQNITPGFLFPEVEQFSESVLSMVLSEHQDYRPK